MAQVFPTYAVLGDATTAPARVACAAPDHPLSHLNATDPFARF